VIISNHTLNLCLDTAFVDRADVIQYIDYPPAEAIYEILRSSLVELMKRGIVEELVGCNNFVKGLFSRMYLRIYTGGTRLRVRIFGI
jgi:hypothetical protein